MIGMEAKAKAFMEGFIEKVSQDTYSGTKNMSKPFASKAVQQSTIESAENKEPAHESNVQQHHMELNRKPGDFMPSPTINTHRESKGTPFGA